MSFASAAAIAQHQQQALVQGLAQAISTPPQNGQLCVPCEVSWRGEDASPCWCCGLPGVRGSIVLGYTPGVIVR